MNLNDIPLIEARAQPIDGSITVLDVRDPKAYAAGHWPGAVNLDLGRWRRLAETADGAIDNHALWHAEIGALGIFEGHPVVVYDDGGMTDAARAWYILQWHGVPVQVIDGGWPALLRAPQARTEERPTEPLAVRYQPPAGHVPRILWAAPAAPLDADGRSALATLAALVARQRLVREPSIADHAA